MIWFGKKGGEIITKEEEKDFIDNIAKELCNDMSLKMTDVLNTNIITDEDRERYNLNKETSLSAEDFLHLVAKI